MLISHCRRWLRQDDGVSTILLGLLAIPMIGAIGLAIDSANLYMAHSRLSYATDSAALAGGRAYFSATRDADVANYFNANFPNGYFGATTTAPTVTPDSTQTQLTVTTAADVPTLFMKIFGYNSVHMTASTTVARDIHGLDVALVLDVTGSMGNGSGSKLDSMEKGANALLDTIFTANTTAGTVYAAVVPFRTAVNIGNTHTDWITGSFNGKFSKTLYTPYTTSQSCDSRGRNCTTKTNYGTATSQKPTSGTYSTATTTEDWMGCVASRTMKTKGGDNLPLDISSQVPSTEAYKFPVYKYEDTSLYGTNGQATITSGRNTYPAYFDNNWPSLPATYGTSVSAVGPNLNCPSQSILPLTNDVSALKATINSFTTVSRGGTQIVTGLTWGWHVLAAEWQSYWGTNLASGDRPKAIVLLTDGDNQVVDWSASSGGTYYGLPGSPASSGSYSNNSDYTAYGRLQTLKADGTASSTYNELVSTKGTNNQTFAKTTSGMEDALDDRMAAACSAIKAQGVEIFTIGYQVPQSAVQGLKDCASDAAHYLSADQSTITATFQTIGNALTDLRIVK